jgi:hypothetical protein
MVHVINSIDFVTDGIMECDLIHEEALVWIGQRGGAYNVLEEELSETTGKTNWKLKLTFASVSDALIWKLTFGGTA